MSDVASLVSKVTEEAVIDVALFDNDMLWAEPIEGWHFSDSVFGKMWDIMRDMSVKGEKIDIVTLSNRYDKETKDPVPSIGALARLGQFTVASSSSFSEYAKELIDLAVRRKAVEQLTEMYNKAVDRTRDIGIDKAEFATEFVADDAAAVGTSLAGDAALRLTTQMDDYRDNPPDWFVVPTGHSGLDRVFDGGFEAGVVGLAGAPGTGKSVWATNWASISAIDNRIGGVVYSVEQKEEEFMARLLSIRSGVRAHKIRRGTVSNQEAARVHRSRELIEAAPLFINDATYISAAKIRADIIRLKRTHDIRWAIVDYIGLLSDLPHLEDTQRLGGISRMLTLIAKELDIVLMAILAVTKEGYEHDSNRGMQAARGPSNLMHDLKYYMTITQDVGGLPGLSEKPDPKVRVLWPFKARMAEGNFRYAQALRFPYDNIPYMEAVDE